MKGRDVVRLDGDVIATATTYTEAVNIAAEHNATVLGLGADVEPLAALVRAGALEASVSEAVDV